MAMKKPFVRSLILALLALLLFVWLAFAQGGYDLSWWTVDGGGGESTGGSYTLGGIIGQPDAGALSGGDYTLAGGLWGGEVAPLLTATPTATPTGMLPTPTSTPTPTPTGTVTPPTNLIYLPIVLKSYP
jgi:hypothetical protein